MRPPAGPALRPDGASAAGLTRSFYRLLREEVLRGNGLLSDQEQEQLRGHYPVMAEGGRYPRRWVETVYAERRAPAAEAILGSENCLVLDAGCGFGSESFLFASLGARVVAVDRSPQQVAIARKRQRHFEQSLGRPLEIEFVCADLERDEIAIPADISVTWLASVLAAIEEQESLLGRLWQCTRVGGKIMITDMNLLNPLFLAGEFRRRRQAMRSNREFARRADFSGMFWRRQRSGARYFQAGPQEAFDDVQFFWSRTLRDLLARVGFESQKVSYSGFLPPFAARAGLGACEELLSRIPLVRSLGYFYLMIGRKVTGTPPQRSGLR